MKVHVLSFTSLRSFLTAWLHSDLLETHTKNLNVCAGSDVLKLQAQ